MSVPPCRGDPLGLAEMEVRDAEKRALLPPESPLRQRGQPRAVQIKLVHCHRFCFFGCLNDLVIHQNFGLAKSGFFHHAACFFFEQAVFRLSLDGNLAGFEEKRRGERT